MRDALRILGIGLIVTALLFVTIGTNGFTSVTADRNIAMTAVDDSDAYVGYDSPGALNVTDGNEGHLVTVTNRFHTQISVVDVNVDSPESLEVEIISRPQIGTGEKDDIDSEIHCEETVEEEPVHVTVSVEGSDVAATLFGDTDTRTVAVTCHPET